MSFVGIQATVDGVCTQIMDVTSLFRYIKLESG